MPQDCSILGEGWVLDESTDSCVFTPTEAPTTFDPGDAFVGSTLEGITEDYFDPYDIDYEQTLIGQTEMGISDLGEAWDVKSGGLTDQWDILKSQIGEQKIGAQDIWGLQKGSLGSAWGAKKEELGSGLGQAYKKSFGFGKKAQSRSGLAHSGTIESTMRGQEREASSAYKRSFGLGKSAYDQALSMGQEKLSQTLSGFDRQYDTSEEAYNQAIETGNLALGQGITNAYQAMQLAILNERKDWEEFQRGTMNEMLLSGIWDTGTGSSIIIGSGQDDDNEWDFPNTSEQEPDYGDFWDDYEQPDLDLEGNPWNLIDPDCGDPGQQGNPACQFRFDDPDDDVEGGGTGG